jgi:hypothetical protein
MINNLYLVFGAPPEGVSQEEFDSWYHGHVRENIIVEGFLGGQRFAVDQTMSGSRVASGTFESDIGAPGAQARPFTHMAMYEYDGRTIEELRTDLFARIESGETVLPPWFDQVTWMTWNCHAIEDRVEPERSNLQPVQ